MNNDFVNLHEIKKSKELTKSQSIRYIAEIKHKELGTFKVIKEMSSHILDIKIEEQFKKWDEQWLVVTEKKKIKETKEEALRLSEYRTLCAQKKQNEIQNILLHGLKKNNNVDFEMLKEKKEFDIPNPKLTLPKTIKQIQIPKPPTYKRLPEEPIKDLFNPKLSFFDKLIKSLAKKKIALAEKQYQETINNWKKKTIEIENLNKREKQEYENELSEIEIRIKELNQRFDNFELEWDQKKQDYYKIQHEQNLKIDLFKKNYEEHNPDSIIEYCETVLNNSQYPDFMPKDFDLLFNQESNLLIIDYRLPTPEKFPTLAEVKYIATKNELKETHLSESQIAKIYENTIYNITLRTIHEIFNADQAEAINIIVFNGWVKAINKATGKPNKSCIASIQIEKKEFSEIDLSKVDPKTCFKKLKGISSSKLIGITAIQPIMYINKNDKRFISSYEVVSNINQGTNLALMDWMDFEHLLREIFEKEFSLNGGEVKVTQASRDGGVDAVAFDPDPIRGGKIVIQAKRYTNTVGVSAVRDLYGTVLNEGATKGILVTTSDYGPDAYEFSKNKPITLMNGANLLYLLEKFGIKARIDIEEAKRIQNG